MQPDLTVQETHDRGDGVLLLDVREPYEWDAGHVAAALHVPMAQVSLENVPTDRPVVVVCRSGNRSGTVARLLQEAGVDAVNMLGGMQAWAAAGLPFETDGDGPPQVA